MKLKYLTCVNKSLWSSFRSSGSPLMEEPLWSFLDMVHTAELQRSCSVNKIQHFCVSQTINTSLSTVMIQRGHVHNLDFWPLLWCTSEGRFLHCNRLWTPHMTAQKQMVWAICLLYWLDLIYASICCIKPFKETTLLAFCYSLQHATLYACNNTRNYQMHVTEQNCDMQVNCGSPEKYLRGLNYRINIEFVQMILHKNMRVRITHEGQHI